MSKQNPPASTASAIGPCPTIIFVRDSADNVHGVLMRKKNQINLVFVNFYLYMKF